MDATADRLLALFVTYGYVVVLLGVFLDNFGLPSSGDVVVVLAASLAQRGDLDVWAVVVVALAAAVASDHTLYWIGRRGARGVLGRFMERPWMASALAAGERFFARHGPKALLMARFLAAVRTEVTFAAGVSAMAYREFTLYDLLSAVLWLAVLVPLGYFFGVEAERVFGGYTTALRVLLAVVAVYAAVRLFLWLVKRRRGASLDERSRGG
ncbi:MAG: DedA family protein [Actinobacteria bacterium]|nr:DedA family protein [Actinomycetota bacterium]